MKCKICNFETSNMKLHVKTAAHRLAALEAENAKLREKVESPLRPLTKFKPGDCIYISKIEGGYQFWYRCEFVSLKSGIVTAEIVSCKPEWNRRTGRITARARNAMIYHQGARDKWARAYWFRNGVENLPT